MMRSDCRTVRCMVVASPDEGVTTRMVHFAATLRRGSYLDVEGVVCPLGMDKDLDEGFTMQQVEIQVKKLHLISNNKDGSLFDDYCPVDEVATMEDGSLV